MLVGIFGGLGSHKTSLSTYFCKKAVVGSSNLVDVFRCTRFHPELASRGLREIYLALCYASGLSVVDVSRSFEVFFH